MKKQKAWVAFMAGALHLFDDVVFACDTADRALEEYLKRFPEGVEELTTHNKGKRITWMLGGAKYGGTVLEEKPDTWIVKPDYDPDSFTVVAKGPNTVLVPLRKEFMVKEPRGAYLFDEEVGQNFTTVEQVKLALHLLFQWREGRKFMFVDANGTVKQSYDRPSNEGDSWPYGGDIFVVGKISPLKDGIDWKKCIIGKDEIDTPTEAPPFIDRAWPGFNEYEKRKYRENAHTDTMKLRIDEIDQSVDRFIALNSHLLITGFPITGPTISEEDISKPGPEAPPFDDCDWPAVREGQRRAYHQNIASILDEGSAFREEALYQTPMPAKSIIQALIDGETKVLAGGFPVAGSKDLPTAQNTDHGRTDIGGAQSECRN